MKPGNHYFTREIGCLIATARKEAGKTQEELAKMVGTQQAEISRIESGQKRPRIDLLEKIIQALGIQIEISTFYP